MRQNTKAWLVSGDGSTKAIGNATPSEEGGTNRLIDSTKAYRKVPWLYRSVDIRAAGVQRIPWKLYNSIGQDVTESPVWANLVAHIPHVMYVSEASMCFYGAAYLFKQTNILKANPHLRLLYAPNMEVQYAEDGTPAGYMRRVGGQKRPLPKEDVVYIWKPEGIAETGPGVPPVESALSAAGLLYSVNTFAEDFFLNGAVKATYLMVDDAYPDPEEMEELENRFMRFIKRMRRGGKNKEVMALSSKVKVETVGSEIKDTAAPEMVKGAREDVATAMGVPHSMVFSNAANFATAQQDELNLLKMTTLPSAQRIVAALNTQFFAFYGITMKLHPEDMEEMQSAELQKATALATLVDKGIYTPDEARQFLGKKPLPVAQPENTGQRTVIDITPTVVANSDAPRLTDQSLKTTDLVRWRRKSLKALKRSDPALVDFVSEHISLAEAKQIEAALREAATPEAVKSAFSGLIGEDHDEDDRN